MIHNTLSVNLPCWGVIGLTVGLFFALFEGVELKFFVTFGLLGSLLGNLVSTFVFQSVLGEFSLVNILLSLAGAFLILLGFKKKQARHPVESENK